MFSYTTDTALDYTIQIKYARIIEGKFESFEGVGYREYRSLNPGESPDKMLEIVFDAEERQDNAFYITDKDLDTDYQHDASQNQRRFFFPMTDDLPLDSIRINEVKLDLAKCAERLRSAGKVIGRSILIKDCIEATNRIFQCVGEENGMNLLESGLVSIRQISGMSNDALKAFLQDILKEQNDHIESLINFSVFPPSSKKNSGTANAFICPLTRKKMSRPVLCALDTLTYEELAIRNYLTKYRRSPFNSEAIPPGQTIDDVLVLNIAIKNLIEEDTKEEKFRNTN